MTDSVGVSVVKQNFEISRGSTSGPKIYTVEEDFKYIEKVFKEGLFATKGKAVLIDPGRRDLLYYMREDNIAKKKKLYRYTRNQKAKVLKSTKFRKLRQLLKPTSIQECETKLCQYSSSTVNADTFVKYLKVRAQVSPMLEEYYDNEDVEKNQRQDTLIPFGKMKLSAYINQIQADKRLSKN